MPGHQDRYSASPPTVRWLFTMLSVVQATLIFTIALVMIPLPLIANEFDLTRTDILLLQVAYGLPFSGLLLLGGRLADRFGGRPLFMTGLSLFAASSLIAAFAPTFEVLAAMRFTQGIAGAIVAPAAMAMLRGVFRTPDGYGRAMAIWGGVSVLGAILGFVLSGILTNWVSWRWMFAVPVIVSSTALLGAAILPRTSDVGAHRPRLDLAGALFATAGIICGSLALIATADHGWTSPLVIALLAASAILIAIFVTIERKVTDPLLPLDFLTDSCRVIGLAGMMLAAAGSVAIELILALYLQQNRGWSPLMTALAFLPFAAALIGANTLAPGIVTRLGAVPATIAGLLATALGFGLLAGIAPDTTYLVGLLPGMILLAAGMSFVFAGAAVLSTTHVPGHQGGLAGGVMNAAMELGPTVGLAILMSVAATQRDVVSGYALAFGTAALLFAVTALLALVATRSGTCASRASIQAA